MEKTTFDLHALMRDIIDQQSARAKEKNLRLTFNDNNECPSHTSYTGNPAQLQQIVNDLCSNAIQFTDRGAVAITVRCEGEQEPGIDTIAISCVDTGIGIDASRLSLLFDSGGLAVTKSLIDSMGGTIAVESRLGQGAVFTVHLPLQRADTTQRILLVEDYPANVLVATLFLEQFGYSYDIASNGVEAVQKVTAGAQPYVAILMDVQMHGMNGLEATRSIRQHESSHGLKRIPIIGMTAHALAGDRERCLAVGMDDYISKPFNPDELCEKLKAANQNK